jgi:hypothetical protein
VLLPIALSTLLPAASPAPALLDAAAPPPDAAATVPAAVDPATAVDAARLSVANKEWDAATTVLRQALRTKPKNAAELHEELARTLAAARAEAPCAADASAARILFHLRSALRLDPNRLDGVKTDAAFAPLQGTLGFQLLVGADGARDLDKLLVRVAWYGLGASAAEQDRLSFQSDGRVRWTDADLATGKIGKDAIVRTGSWTRAGDTVVVTFDGQPAPPAPAALDGEALVIDGVGSFGDDDRECVVE